VRLVQGHSGLVDHELFEFVSLSANLLLGPDELLVVEVLALVVSDAVVRTLQYVESILRIVRGVLVGVQLQRQLPIFLLDFHFVDEFVAAIDSEYFVMGSTNLALDKSHWLGFPIT